MPAPKDLNVCFIQPSLNTNQNEEINIFKNINTSQADDHKKHGNAILKLQAESN